MPFTGVYLQDLKSSPILFYMILDSLQLPRKYHKLDSWGSLTNLQGCQWREDSFSQWGIWGSWDSEVERGLAKITGVINGEFGQHHQPGAATKFSAPCRALGFSSDWLQHHPSLCLPSTLLLFVLQESVPASSTPGSLPELFWGRYQVLLLLVSCYYHNLST